MKKISLLGLLLILSFFSCKTYVQDETKNVIVEDIDPIGNIPHSVDTSLDSYIKKEETLEDTTIHLFVEEEPEFPGGVDVMMKFLAENIVFPEKAKEAGVRSYLYVTFVVEKDGSLSGIRILRDNLGLGCGQEAMRVVKMMPKWKPGRQKGKEVRVQFNLPIHFGIKK